ncbi:MAG: glycosyltransferase family 2 protein, partial [Nocardioides sp.]|nr:glycosyltransferase family 2 protein [Nocardioides sp.]
QAKAERGKGTAWLYPFVAVAVFFVVAGFAWVQVPIDRQSDILAVGWPILGIITILQTAWMIIKGTKRYRGFKA